MKAGAVIDEFIQSPTGGNQFYRWNEFQGQDAREAARQMLLTAGLEQVGSQTKTNYQVVENDTYYRDLARKRAEEKPIPYSLLDNPSEVGQDMRGGDTFGNEGGYNWFDKVKLRSKATVDTGETRTVDAGMGVILKTAVKKVDNSLIREEVEPELKRALRINNPDLSEGEISKKAEEYFKSDKFVLDNPEVKQALKVYETSIRNTKQHLRLMQQSTLNSLERPIDKNFNADNITKDVKKNIPQKTFYTIEDGNLVPYTNEMRELYNLDGQPNSGYKLNMDFAGIVDAENPFGSKDYMQE